MTNDLMSNPATVDSETMLLSVVVLVAATDISLLDDLLNCLDAQTDQRFEVIVCSDDDLVAACTETAQRFDEILHARTRVIGSRVHDRTAKVKTGIAASCGRYVVIMGADTVLFSRWAADLATLIGSAPDRVLRSVAVSMPSIRTAVPGLAEGYVAVEGPQRSSAPGFDAIGELSFDRTPFGSYAIPRNYFIDAGYVFDEDDAPVSLRALFLRAALSRGTASADTEVTVMLRTWGDDDVDHVAAKSALLLNDDPLILPPGSIGSLQQLMTSSDDLRRALVEMERERNDVVAERDSIGQHAAALTEQLAQFKNAGVGSVLESDDDTGAQVVALTSELTALRSSTSWKLTAPIRKMTSLKRIIRRTPH